jgi:putative membrane protein
MSANDRPDIANERNADARDHLANERTLLAWIRTSIGIMAFGFVVAKFSLFVRQFAFLVGKEGTPNQGMLSFTMGTILVGVGSVVLILSFIRYKQTRQQLLRRSYAPSTGFVLALVLTIIVISLVIIYYLLRSSKLY